ncbi:MAG: DNA-processing protein DprA [bacterium]
MLYPPVYTLNSENERYPVLLRESKGHPKLLYASGEVTLCELPSISIIGSRRVSDYGERMVRQLVPGLVRSGLVIVSGLAYGVDGYAHSVALQNEGKCVVVLGSGLDRPYPQRNVGLYGKILESGGCAFSEYPLGTGPQSYHFPARNRIVAALSPVTLIIEAGEQSGTLITARFALEAGREVCVVPGDVTREQSRGILSLLKQGAHPVGSVEDILELYTKALPTVTPLRLQPALTGTPATLYDLISHGCNEANLLSARSGLSISELRSVLSVLELDGYIYCNGTQWQSIL